MTGESVYGLLAQAVLVLHTAFVLFVAVGGLLALAWPKLAWLHAPCLLWGVAIVIGGWICPLTPLELDLRARAGLPPYSGGFLDHYLIPWVYPEGLGRGTRIVLVLIAAVVNIGVYLRLWFRWRPRDPA